jgi:hypothetical protein
VVQLLGRRAEYGVLDRLIEAVGGQEPGAGDAWEPNVGKTRCWIT